MSIRLPPPDPQLTALFGWFFLLCALPIGFLTLARSYDKLVAPSWPRTHAQVISSEMYQQNRSGKWCVRLRYRYVVDGEVFLSRRLSPSRMGSAACDRDKLVIEARFEKLQPGARVKIGVHPSSPGRSFVYLEGLDHSDVLFFALALILAGGGIRAIREAKAMRPG